MSGVKIGMDRIAVINRRILQELIWALFEYIVAVDGMNAKALNSAVCPIAPATGLGSGTSIWVFV